MFLKDLEKSVLEDYLSFLRTLNYFENKNDFLNENSFKIHYLVLGIIKQLDNDKIFYRVEKYGFMLSIFLKDGKIRTIIGTNTGINSSSGFSLSKDKSYTYEILYNNNFKIPKTYLLFGNERNEYKSNFNGKNEALIFSKNIGFPIIVKPNSGTCGDGVEKINSINLLESWIDSYNKGKKFNDIAIIQEFISGDDYRIVYLNGEIITIYKREPLSIVGDGKNNIKNLITQKKLSKDLKKLSKNYLKNIGFDLLKILLNGEKLYILPTSNISTGGTATIINLEKVEITKLTTFLDKIAKNTGLNYFGIDIISNGKIIDGTILEINSNPGFDGIQKLDKNIPFYLGEKIWNYIKKIEKVSIS